jgi:eukaryotic-like serine/threonine-protein kinase
MEEYAGANRNEFIGNYRLRKPLATGVNSQVYEVVELNSNLHFAMKLLLPEKVHDEDLRKDLLHEADVGMKLAHPNIIRIVHVDKSTKNPYFVMEFFPTGNLKDRINAAVKFPRQAEFLRERGQDILKQAATAFAFINAKGWLHRDIKPDNILVNSASEVRVIDLAIADPVSTGIGGWFQRREKLAKGTLSYMSPETLRCERLDYRSDIYSFGATAYELVTGRQPFRAASHGELMQKHLHEPPLPPKTYNPMVTREFNDLVMAMLEKDREKRPRNFHEVLMRMRKMHIYMRKPKPRGGAAPPA